MANILVIDDVPEITFLLATYLKQQNYNVDSCLSVKDGFMKLSQNNYDLILLDNSMPDINGLEACQKIKNSNQWKDIPVIMVTGSIEPEIIEKAFEVGAIDYIQKPINKKELFARVANALTIKNNEQKLKDMYREIKKDLDIASKIQKHFLPPEKFYNEQISVNYTYQPFQSISGDLFGLEEINDKQTIFYIGDITGHGVQAALLMTTVKTHINYLIKEGIIEPYQVIQRLHKELQAYFNEQFMTFIFGVIDYQHNQVKFYNAGHPSPYLIQDNSVTLIDSKGGIPLGLLFEFEFKQNDQTLIDFNQHDQLIFYTDGIIEQYSDENSIVWTKMETVLEKLVESQTSFWNLCSHIKDVILSHNNYVRDDYTIVAIKRNNLQNHHQINVFSSLEEISKKSAELSNYFNDVFHTESLVDLGCLEYLNNIVLHGDNQSSKQSIELTISSFETFCQIEIIDYAKPWKFPKSRQVSMPDSNELSGRGIALLHHIFDEILYEKKPNQNKATLRKAILC